MVNLPAHCTAQDQLSDMPCLQCLSEKELLAAIVYILATYEGYDLSEDLHTLADDAACFRCLSDKQKLQGFVHAMLNSLLGRDLSMDAVRADVKCLLCYGDGDLKAMAAKLFCEYWYHALHLL